MVLAILRLTTFHLPFQPHSYYRTEIVSHRVTSPPPLSLPTIISTPLSQNHGHTGSFWLVLRLLNTVIINPGYKLIVPQSLGEIGPSSKLNTHNLEPYSIKFNSSNSTVTKRDHLFCVSHCQTTISLQPGRA